MKNILFLFFAFCYCFHSGQKKKNPKDLPDDYAFSEGEINKNYHPVSFGQRIKNYPFNKASKIKIVSYNLNFKKSSGYLPPPPPPKTKEDSVQLNEFYHLPKSIDFREIIENQSEKEIEESKTLNLEEISKLSHIIFNTCNKHVITMFSQSGCFSPRNAIVFYDENDRIFEIIEICFECGNVESYPSKFFNWKKACEFIYPELEKFFQSKGLQTQYISK
ncbi:hypothetical protein [Chryseobacterium gambrini]|uniref:hypothetical protein n=1 Tax=Chryseobacterium gambrini TaxID=373672 RepID=UPI0022F1DA8B|nr:hypothetical protein [Chryseobacterium gambrini]WBV52897.1 hypothetical protein PFY09_01000 [Chryseobacterium gambrini]